MTLIHDLSDVFLALRLGLWVWGREGTEVKFCSHLIPAMAYLSA